MTLTTLLAEIGALFRGTEKRRPPSEPGFTRPLPRCPVQGCRIAKPHSHVEALLGRIRES